MPITKLHDLQMRLRKQANAIHFRTARVVATNRDPKQVVILRETHYQLCRKLAPRGKAYWRLMAIDY